MNIPYISIYPCRPNKPSSGPGTWACIQRPVRWPGSSEPPKPKRFFEVCGTIPSSIPACMPLINHLPSKRKEPTAGGKMVPSLLKMVLMNSDDIVVNLLNNAFIGKTVKPIVLHIDDQVLMYLDSDNVCRLDDFSGNLQIICGRRKVI